MFFTYRDIQIYNFKMNKEKTPEFHFTAFGRFNK
ncbi:Uncharacterised protein [Capnocytophaga canimorsus]|nr:hypothetical protein CLV61_1796 [Capnocytophaga canimorsus]STA71746.1 Uncharacterised protein [Capnocytophaga canimorsus]